MKELDRLINEKAAVNFGLTDRRDVLNGGGNDRAIGDRLSSGRLTRVQAGVYQVGVTPLGWRGLLRAAVMAAGPGAVASHRAAMVLWGLDGISAAPLEITVPVQRRPFPTGVIVHRTRRPIPMTVVDGIPVTSAERSLLDGASCLPELVIAKAFESAVRRNLTSPEKVLICLDEQGGKGVRGAPKLRRILSERSPGRPAGSAGEVEVLSLIRRAGIEEPVRQHTYRLRDGSVAVVDIAWPHRDKGLEIDGLEAHASAAALEGDLDRQNKLLEIGVQLRRFTVRQIRRDPEYFVESIRRFLQE